MKAAGASIMTMGRAVDAAYRIHFSRARVIERLWFQEGGGAIRSSAEPSS